MIKGLIQEGDITVAKIYAPNTEAPKFIKQILTNIKEEIDNNTITVGKFNITLTSMDRSSREKINKETLVLKETLIHKDLIGISRTFHAKQQNTHSFQMHMEHSPVQIIC